MKGRSGCLQTCIDPKKNSQKEKQKKSTGLNVQNKSPVQKKRSLNQTIFPSFVQSSMGVNFEL